MTLLGVPDQPGVAGRIFTALADANVNVAARVFSTLGEENINKAHSPSCVDSERGRYPNRPARASRLPADSPAAQMVGRSRNSRRT